MKTLKIFSLMLALALATTAAHADFIAWSRTVTDSFEYFITLSDVEKEPCPDGRYWAVMELEFRYGPTLRFAEGCWMIDRKGEITIDLWVYENGKHVQFIHNYQDYRVKMPYFKGWVAYMKH